MNELKLASYMKKIPDDLASEYGNAAGAAGVKESNFASSGGDGGRRKKHGGFIAGAVVLAAGIITGIVIAVSMKNINRNTPSKSGGSPLVIDATQPATELQATPAPGTEATPAGPDATGQPPETVTSDRVEPTRPAVTEPAFSATASPDPAENHTGAPASNTPAGTERTADVTASTAPTEVTVTATPVIKTATPAPTPVQHVEVRASHIDFAVPKGELYPGESLRIEALVIPADYNTGTLRWKIVKGGDFASIDPVTGVLTAKKGGSVVVTAYMEEYETKNSLVSIYVIGSQAETEPAHEQELAAGYKPDDISPGDGITEEMINIRRKFLVYNGQTPDILPYYTRGSSGEKYRNSPYGNDYTVYIRLCDMNVDTYVSSAFRLKGVKVIFSDINGNVVGYSYTNSDGVAAFTIRKPGIIENDLPAGGNTDQEVEPEIDVENAGPDWPYLFVEAHIDGYKMASEVFAGWGNSLHSDGAPFNERFTGPYINSGTAETFDLRFCVAR